MNFLAFRQYAAGVATAFMAVGLPMVGTNYVLDARARQARAPAERFACTVIGVHDGDGPIYCLEPGEDGKPLKIRLHGIAAREIGETCNPGQPCPAASAVAARAALDRLTRGQVLSCEKTGMSYGRVTAWCRRGDGVEINCAMIRSGTALRWSRYDRDQRLCRG